MMSRRSTAVFAGVALGVVAVFGWSAARSVEPVRVGGTAPEFQALTVEAPFIEKRLADYADNVVIVNIWATWCAPCVVEMPSLEALHRRYAKDGLRIVGVSVDAPGSMEQIREFRNRLGLTFEILHDAADIRATYQTAGVPESFVIGRDGRIRRRVFSAENWDSPSNRKLIEQLLGPGA
jgi:cytochrome c biogenesis protein CcmG, thiol:disulfide interchange protein DsbE